MANKIVSILEAAGKDVEKGLSKVLPILNEAVPFFSLLDPALGPLFTTVVGVVTQTEQKYAALGKQTGTGIAKFAEALSIAAPVVSQSFSLAGKPSDGTTVSNYVQSVVTLLNNIPSSQPAA